jgi:hypothetical protein
MRKHYAGFTQTMQCIGLRMLIFTVFLEDFQVFFLYRFKF